MNITFSADPALIEKARNYAQLHNTSLNQLIRDFLERTVGEPTREEAVAELMRLTGEHAGRSPDGFRFDRDEAHGRQ
ncbi:MAG: DUF6364 family protein [Planctomycetota bacterium]